MKKLCGMVVCLMLCFTACSLANAGFTVEDTEDGRGVVITGYTGKATELKIPAKIQGKPVRGIRESAFEGKKTITSVEIPEGVTVILYAAFNDMRLVHVTLPSTLRIINSWAFAYNGRLKSMIIPEGVTRIGEGAFSYCPSLASVTLPQSLTTLGNSAFMSTAITAITLPPKLTIVDGWFYGCKKLTSIDIPEGVTEIARLSFTNCTALTSVTLPSTIKMIGEDAFVGCSALTTITIPNSVKEIDMAWFNNPFAGCSNLTNASRTRLRNVGIGIFGKPF